MPERYIIGPGGFFPKELIYRKSIYRATKGQENGKEANATHFGA